MKKITDIKGRSHVFTLTDGTTLRVFARKSIEIDDKLISEEINTAQKLGLIRIVNLNVPSKSKQSKSEPSVSNTEVKNNG